MKFQLAQTPRARGHFFEQPEQPRRNTNNNNKVICSNFPGCSFQLASLLKCSCREFEQAGSSGYAVLAQPMQSDKLAFLQQCMVRWPRVVGQMAGVFLCFVLTVFVGFVEMPLAFFEDPR